MTTAQDSTPNKEPSGAQKLIGDFAPKLRRWPGDAFCQAWSAGVTSTRTGPIPKCSPMS
jgi:hypothetical protein